MTSLIELETEDFAAASRSLHARVADPLWDAATRLTRQLYDVGGMAGTDPAGREWAAAYDRAGAAALGATGDVLNGCFKVSAMFAQTARNYEAADAASTEGVRGHLAAVTAPLPGPELVSLVTDLPTAAGGSGGTPHGWSLIADVVGQVWPNGHQDRLRAAASAWRASADEIWLRSEAAAVAAVPAWSDNLAEFDDMWTVCDALYMQLRAVAEAQRALAHACDELAAHLDEVHSAVESELWNLLAWSAGIQVTGGLLAVISLGTAEAPTQAVEAARVASTAARIAALIEKFTALARTAAQSVSALVDRVAAVSARVRRLLDVPLSQATVVLAARARTIRVAGDVGAIGRLSGEAAGFPPLVISIANLERKFKHAADFGVSAARGRPGFNAFRAAIGDFVSRPSVTRIYGTYRGERVILSYEADTRLVVIQTLSGDFVSGWRMTQVQRDYVVERGVLGHG